MCPDSSQKQTTSQQLNIYDFVYFMHYALIIPSAPSGHMYVIHCMTCLRPVLPARLLVLCLSHSLNSRQLLWHPVSEERLSEMLTKYLYVRKASYIVPCLIYTCIRDWKVIYPSAFFVIIHIF